MFVQIIEEFVSVEVYQVGSVVLHYLLVSHRHKVGYIVAIVCSPLLLLHFHFIVDVVYHVTDEHAYGQQHSRFPKIRPLSVVLEDGLAGCHVVEPVDEHYDAVDGSVPLLLRVHRPPHIPSEGWVIVFFRPVYHH